jgi:phenylpropionate dioxygenase-like ring-hydroxylating dioxygenase large terminal subunit
MLLKDIWYVGALSRDVRAGALSRRLVAGEPVLLGRTADGAAFALRDVCPHRAAPLSAGRIVEADAAAGGGATVECPYHGWRFRAADGVCAAVPSLVEGQSLRLDRIRAGAFPLVERGGLIWLYVPAEPRAPVTPSFGPPEPPVDLGMPKLVLKAAFDCPVDHAVVGLMDPAHGPYVHRQWWWRTRHSVHEKAKAFAPRPYGFAMTQHAPSSNSFAYRLFGGAPTTEIDFRLPGIRFETVRTKRGAVLALTAVTPLDETRTEVTQIFYWNIGLLTLIRPLIGRLARIFLDQDRRMVDLQQMGLRYESRLMLIDDSDAQAKWYQALKREWIAHREEGRDFRNPVPETVLRWRS